MEINRWQTLIMIIVISCSLCISFCAKSQKQSRESKTMEAVTMKLTSTAFNEKDTIPAKFSCEGDDVSPELAWTGAPENVKSFALICDDPDAPMGTWIHWVVINIPPDISGFEEGIKFSEDSLYTGTIECMNSFKRVSYGGPCPPPGPVHRYFFKLYALDTMLDLTTQSHKEDVEKAMEGHILAQTSLMGTYKR